MTPNKPKIKKMKNHNCEKYRFTIDKYLPKEDGGGFGDRVLVSWCSLCGKKMRMIPVEIILKTK